MDLDNSLREFVANYFTYIKKKAEIFCQMDPAYFATRKKDR